MTPYFIFFATEFLLIVAGFFVKDRDIKSFLFFVVVLVLTVFSGVRGLVGADTAAYHDVFKTADLSAFPFDSWLLFEPGFSGFMWIVKAIFDDPYVFMFSVSVVQGFVLFQIAKDAPGKWWFVFGYLSTFYLQNQFNIVRAGLAVLILIYAYVLAGRGKSNFWVLCLAVLIHYSALVSIPFLLVGRRAWWSFGIFLGGAVFFLSAFVGDHLLEKFYYYFVDSSFYSGGSVSFGPFFLITAFFMALIHFLCNEKKGGRVHLLFFVLLVLKVVQMVFPILWRVYDLLYCLWFGVAVLSVCDRGVSFRGVAVSVLCVLNFIFVTLYALNNEMENMIQRENKGGEVISSVYDSPLVPYKTLWE